MGGSVALTIREPDGQEHRMCRWTNIMPAVLNNLRLLNKDPSYIREMTAKWYEMKRDYEAHEKDGNFSEPMSPVYAHHPFLAPHDYGLIVVDMAKNQILNYQGYCAIGNISSAAIEGDITANENGGHTMLFIGPESQRPKQVGMRAFQSKDEYSDAMRFKRLFEAGRITRVNNRKKKETISLGGKSLEDVVKLIRHPEFFDFPINMLPYQLTTYQEHCPEDAQKMREQIRNLGFVLSDKEEKLWDEWIKEYSEDH